MKHVPEVYFPYFKINYYPLSAVAIRNGNPCDLKEVKQQLHV